MNKVIVGIDFSDITSLLIAEAEVQARCRVAGVYLIHVAAPDPEFVGYEVGPVEERQFRARELRTEKRELEKLAQQLRSLGVDAVPLLMQGETHKLLLREVDRLKAGLLIMGTHGKGVARTALLGSTSHAVIQHSRCPVLLVPHKAIHRKG